MRRHLPATRSGAARRPHCLQQQVFGAHAKAQAQRAVAVVRKKPIVARAQVARRRDQRRLVPGARDLKINVVLPLENDLEVVEAAAQQHRAHRGVHGCKRQWLRRAAPMAGRTSASAAGGVRSVGRRFGGRVA